MNSFEIYRLWTVFSQMMEDSSLSVDAKVRVGREMLSALPPALLCASSSQSLEVVKEAMKGKLADLSNNNAKPETTSTGGLDSDKAKAAPVVRTRRNAVASTG